MPIFSIPSVLKFSVSEQKLFFCCAVALAIAGFTGAARAEDADAVADFATAVGKVNAIYQAAAPAAIGSTAFGIGAVMVKRVAFS